LPLEVQSIQKSIKNEFPHLDILSTDVQYIAKSLNYRSSRRLKCLW